MNVSTHGLQQLASAELDAIFWTPELIGRPSTWWSHVPFAHWIMTTCAPRIFVELGARNGVSYAAFCEAASRAKIGTRCYAVDEWNGERPADSYGEEVYLHMKEFHDRRYGAFSELLRCSFDDALSHFEDGSIDLLHINGGHSYDAVKRDFESWHPKLSAKAVVLFNDTNVRVDDFAVHQFFGELAKRYSSFEFLHGRGLGLVIVGENAPESVKALCAIETAAEISTLRQRFSHIGTCWSLTSDQHIALITSRDVQQSSDQAFESDRAKLSAAIELKDRVNARAVRRLAELRAVIRQVAADNSTLSVEKSNLSTRLIEQDGKLAELQSALAETMAKVAEQGGGPTESHAALLESQTALAESRAALTESQAALAESRAALANSQAALAESHAALAETQAALAESRAALAETQAALAELQATVAESQAGLSNSQDAVAESHAALAESRAALAESHAALAESHAALVELEAAFAGSQVALSELEAEYTESQAALAESKTASSAQLIEYHTQIAELQAASTARLGELDLRTSYLENRLMKTQSEKEYFFNRYSAAFNDPSTGIKSRIKNRLLLLLRPFTAKRLRARALLDQIRRSPFFDREWYIQTYPEVLASHTDPAVHYLMVGGFAGFDPGPMFSSRDYFEVNPDVAKAKVNPLLHYVQHGQREGRFRRSSEMARLETFRTESVSAERSGPVRTIRSMLFISGEPQTPGNRYRVTRYVDAAKANGVDARWISHASLAEHLGEISKYDVIMVWRAPWDGSLSDAFEIARQSGARLVFDVDDLMTEPDLVQVEIIDGIRSQDLPESIVRDHFTRIRRTMLESDLCTTTTDELAFFMRWAGKTTHVLRNGFDQSVHDCSRIAAQNWRAEKDQLIRMGYAGGSRTHQRDFGVAIEAVARILRENPLCRLVLFRTPDGRTPLIDVHEYPVLDDLGEQIEWRDLQPLEKLPFEMARFDVNLAPLEISNPFCEAKSELKFFEAALVNVPTVASPTGPYRVAIDHGETGFLAATADDWYVYLDRLVRSPELRTRLAQKAYHVALGKYGTLQRNLRVGRFIEQLRGGVSAARGFALESLLSRQARHAPKVYPSDLVFEQSKGGYAAVTVVIPLYNYAQYVREALDSVFQQTLANLDLVIVDGCSTDDSLAVALKWAKSHADRFNRIVVLKNQSNVGLGFCRNSGFDAADSRYVLPLDADNRLLPECCESLLAVAEASSVAYVYPTIQHFGASTKLISNVPYDAQRFVAGNFVDAMALVSKEAWALIGGYDHVRHGWEDYDFWCRLAEVGLAGEWCRPVLAEYRVHPQSMMTIQTLVPGNYSRLHSDFEKRHPWVWLHERHTSRTPHQPSRSLLDPNNRTRLDDLLPILRCPVTRQKLIANADRSALISADGTETWPIVSGRPVLSRDNPTPALMPFEHINNELPEEAVQIFRSTKGWVLNLSAGGSREKFDHVVEVEYAMFRHTDVVADAHVLPFDDNCFDAIVVMNAFEHYREPHKVSAELLRILKPDGIVMVRTAFLQPLHERPWHFYNCTRYGLSEWFKAFETDELHVPDNFTPNHSIAWLASECEAALRQDVSAGTADAFLDAKIGDMVDFWRNPASRNGELWSDFHKISQTNQEVTAAGFEFFGRKPQDRPKLKG